MYGESGGSVPECQTPEQEAGGGGGGGGGVEIYLRRVVFLCKTL